MAVHRPHPRSITLESANKKTNPNEEASQHRHLVGNRLAPEKTIAAIIIGKATYDDWVVKAVAITIGFIKELVQREQQWGTRSEQRKRLGKISEAAALIAKELNDGEIISLLQNPSEPSLPGSDEFEYKRYAQIGARWLEKQATLSQSRISTKAGRQKHIINKQGMTAAQSLAIIIFGIWNEFHKSQAPITNSCVMQVCIKIWAEAGGSFGHSGNGWRRHLKEARQKPKLFGHLELVNMIISRAQSSSNSKIPGLEKSAEK